MYELPSQLETFQTFGFTRVSLAMHFESSQFCLCTVYGHSINNRFFLLFFLLMKAIIIISCAGLKHRDGFCGQHKNWFFRTKKTSFSSSLSISFVLIHSVVS